MQKTKFTSEQNRQQAEILGINALQFLAAEPERFSRFLALTGVGPANLREQASDPGFLGAVLDYLLGDEPLMLQFCGEFSIDPAQMIRSRSFLHGRQA